MPAPARHHLSYPATASTGPALARQRRSPAPGTGLRAGRGGSGCCPTAAWSWSGTGSTRAPCSRYLGRPATQSAPRRRPPASASSRAGAPSCWAPRCAIWPAVTDLANLWDTATARHLEAALAAAPDAAARRRLLSRAVACRLAAAAPPDPAVLGVVRLLSQPRASVTEAARHAHLSGRQLRRRFADHVGLPPKALQAVLRFQRLRAQLASPGTAQVTLARAAADCGYFDQAHLCHDSARLAGITPTELLCPRSQPTAGTRPEPSAVSDELVPGRPRRPGSCLPPHGFERASGPQ